MKEISLRTGLIVLAFYAFLAVAWTFPLILHFNDGIYGFFRNTDMRGTVWYLWWLQDAHIRGLSEKFCPWIGAPIGTSFEGTPDFWIAIILSKVGVAVSSPLIFFNSMSIAALTLAGFFSFRLVYGLTGTVAAGLLSGLIFMLSPFQLNKLSEFGFAFIGFTIPWFFHNFLKNALKPDIRTLLVAGFIFSWTVAFNTYYAYFLLLALLLVLIYLAFQGNRVWNGFKARLLLKNAFFTFLGIGLVTLVLNLADLFKIAFKFFGSKTPALPGDAGFYERAISYLTAQSARPLSYLMPASTHPVFGAWTKKMFGSFLYGRGSNEQTLYVGWISLFLAWIAVKTWRNRSAACQTLEGFWVRLFHFLGWAAFIVSMPPLIDLLIVQIPMPGFWLHKALPMFRAYARIAVIVLLSVSVLAGFGLKQWMDRNAANHKRFLIAGLLCAGLLFEFTNMPPGRVTVITQEPPLTIWLKALPEKTIIAEYPMVLNPQGEAQENYDYLFEQTRHRKRLANGILQGELGVVLKEKIVKIDSPAAPATLKSLGVDYVVLHEDLYRKGGRREAVDVLWDVPYLDGRPGFRRVKTFKDISVFEIV